MEILHHKDNKIDEKEHCEAMAQVINNAILEEKLNSPAPLRTTRVAEALHEIADKIHRRSLVVIFSDMMDDSSQFDELFGALQHLKHKKHEVVLFHTMDLIGSTNNGGC